MSHFLLIHGSWHGAWCWYKIAPRLRNAGHSVLVPDLPGRILNPKKLPFVSLKYMVRNIGAQLPADRKTTIVVHSRYGILASSLAEAYPDKIERTIYLASFMLPSGVRTIDYFRWDKGSHLRPYFSASLRGMWDKLDPAIFKEGLYHDCSEEDIMLGHSLLGPEPLRPALAKLKFTDERYGTVPRAYIRLTEDRAVTPALQDHVLNQTPVDRVENIKASHSAYFSKPDELTEKILKLAGN